MQNFSNSLWLHVAKSKGVTAETLIVETEVWPMPFLINMFAALKGFKIIEIIEAFLI